MKSHFKLSIPKPCHENWQKMTPKENGRFCKSCTKTVVDFTVMAPNDIEKHLNTNRGKQICGRIKNTQLDAINLKISETVFKQNLNYQKLFLLVLLLVMGTTILNCKDEKGHVKKIQSVEITYTNNDTLEVISEIKKDTAITNTIYQQKDVSLEEPEEPLIMGSLVETVGLIEAEPPSEPYHCSYVDILPKFKDTPTSLSKEEEFEYFKKRIGTIVLENFMITQGHLNLSGKQRIHAQFEIDRSGNVINIKSRAPHPKFEKETIRVLNLLPQFTPARNDNQSVAVTYSLPITFVIED